MYSKKLLLISLLIPLTGCAYIKDKDQSFNYQAKACKTIQRQIAFNTNNPNQDAKWQSASQRAHMKQLYIENDCKHIKA